MALDPLAATAALIDSLGAQSLAKAASYTAGNHWLLLWNLVVGGVLAWVVVRSGLLDKLDARLGRRGPNVRALAAGAVYFPVSALLALPWTLYAEWWRERDYGRTSQPLGDFLGQALLSTLISSVVGALFFVGVYALIRRTGPRWWLWSGALTAATAGVLMLAGPVFIEPLFNDYKPVPPGEVRTALEEMAKRSGVPPDRLFVFDGSRQSNNFTANVAGIGGSARIAISDVAFKGASLDEVKAVTGHEIGHYVLGHIWWGIAAISALCMIAFLLADRLFPAFARLFGSGAALPDPRGLPVVLFMVSLFLLLATPVMSALSRISERASDRYSLETVDLPDALATALVKTAEYRDPRPHPLQEILFYSHPSVERRVLAAMQWKASGRTGGSPQ
ncbi:MAG: M48 family metallopeptidase [Lysobacter sp.]|nr:M48 family metallopeptidase [Lysobacter sp.]